MTTVVNIRNYLGPPCVYIGRPGPFGNPYEIGKDGARTEVIRKFEIDFHIRIRKDLEWRKLVLGLKGKILG